MLSVVMRVDSAGVIWALAKCRVCGQVHKYPAAEAIDPGVHCKSCKHAMELAGAVISSGALSSQTDGGTTAKPDGHPSPP